LRKLGLCLIATYSLLITNGCSNNLSRRHATKAIEAKIQPHYIPMLKRTATERIPGFELPSEDQESGPIFHLQNHESYGPLIFDKKDESPDEEDYLVNALSQLGYVTVQENGPTSKIVFGSKLEYSHSRSVALTSKVGALKDTGYSRNYSAGFSCYPSPDFKQCNSPDLIEQSKSFIITGITQDQVRAEVHVLIDWKLTPFAQELKPYATEAIKNENKFGDDSKVDRYPALYSWIHFLNDHAATGSSPATILFQKFDDGWRIVDSNGNSTKDYAK
jgi:hypothetical protein